MRCCQTVEICWNAQGFGEIAFCAVTAMEQVKGFGTRLMNHTKVLPFLCITYRAAGKCCSCYALTNHWMSH